MEKIEIGNIPTLLEQGEPTESGFGQQVWSAIESELYDKIGREVTAEWDDIPNSAVVTSEDMVEIRNIVDGRVADAMRTILDTEEYMGWIVQNEQTEDIAVAGFLAETIVDKYLHPDDDEEDALVAA